MYFLNVEIVCVNVCMCVLTEGVRARAASVQRDAGKLWVINTNNCVYIRHKLRIGGVYTVATHTNSHTNTHTQTLANMSTCFWSICVEVTTDCACFDTEHSNITSW